MRESKRSWALAAAMVLGMALTATPALAAAPANDDRKGATAIGTLPFATTQSTVEATTAQDDPNCHGKSRTVWFKYTSPTAQTVLVDTTGSSYDTTLAAFYGYQDGSLGLIACNDDWNASTSRLQLDVSAGQVVYFMVGSYGQTSGGELKLNVRRVLAGYVDFELSDSALLNTTNGDVTVRGTVYCSQERTVLIEGGVRQRTADGVRQGSFVEELNCLGTELWNARAIGSFTRGQVTVAATATTSDAGLVSSDDDWGVMTLKSCTRIGTPQRDVLRGTERNDIICGLAGNDSIFGAGGNDRIDGGEGNDSIYGGPGNDILIGGPGRDYCVGGGGSNAFRSCE